MATKTNRGSQRLKHGSVGPRESNYGKGKERPKIYESSDIRPYGTSDPGNKHRIHHPGNSGGGGGRKKRGGMGY